MATQLRFKAHPGGGVPSGIIATPSFMGSTQMERFYERNVDKLNFIDLQEGDVIYERVGSLKKRPIVKTVTKDFEIGKDYTSSYGKVWTCYLRTPLGWLFKRPNGALSEVDREGRSIPSEARYTNHVIFTPEIVTEVTGEEWYIDRTDV